MEKWEFSGLKKKKFPEKFSGIGFWAELGIFRLFPKKKWNFGPPFPPPARTLGCKNGGNSWIFREFWDRSHSWFFVSFSLLFSLFLGIFLGVSFGVFWVCFGVIPFWFPGIFSECEKKTIKNIWDFYGEKKLGKKSWKMLKDPFEKSFKKIL